jgi:hypothetical protein
MLSISDASELDGQIICIRGMLVPTTVPEWPPAAPLRGPRETCRQCPKRNLCTPQNQMVEHGRAVTIRVESEAMVNYHEKMATPEAKAIYRRRAPTAEFPHAWLKDKLK